MKLSYKIRKILEKNEFAVYESPRADGLYDIELTVFTPLGEDYTVSLIYTGTALSFVEEFKEYSDNFDPEDHAAMWIEHRGERGIPNSIQALLNDALWIKSFLDRVSQELQNID